MPTRPGAPERSGEVEPIREAVKALLLNNEKRHEAAGSRSHEAASASRVVELLSHPATLDGGDVMFDGTCLWVGLTARTNESAVAQLREAFAGTASGVAMVVGLPVRDLEGKTLHLKVIELVHESTAFFSLPTLLFSVKHHGPLLPPLLSELALHRRPRPHPRGRQSRRAAACGRRAKTSSR